MADGPWTQFATPAPQAEPVDGPWMQFAPQAPQPAPATSGKNEGGFGEAFGASLRSTPAGFGKGIEAIGVASELEPVEHVGRWIMEKTAPAQSNYVPLEWKDVEDVGGAWKWLKEQAGAGLGSTVVPVAAAGVGALGGAAAAGPVGAAIGGAVGAAGSGVPLNIGDAAAQFEEEGLDKKSAAKAGALVGLVISVPDVFSTLSLTKPLVGPVKKEIQRTVIHEIANRMLKGATLEGATEGLQQLIQETAASYLGGDAPLGARVERIAGSVVGGAFGGGVVGGAAGALPRSGDVDAPPSAADLSELILKGEGEVPNPPETEGPGQQLPLPLGEPGDSVARPSGSDIAPVEPPIAQDGDVEGAAVKTEPAQDKRGNDVGQQQPIVPEQEPVTKFDKFADDVYLRIQRNPTNLRGDNPAVTGSSEAIKLARQAMRARQNYGTLSKQGKADLAKMALDLAELSMKKAYEAGFRFNLGLVEPAKPTPVTPVFARREDNPNDTRYLAPGQKWVLTDSNGRSINTFDTFEEANEFSQKLGADPRNYNLTKQNTSEEAPGGGVRGSNPPIQDLLKAAPEFAGREGKFTPSRFGLDPIAKLDAAYPELDAFMQGKENVLVVGKHLDSEGVANFVSRLARRFIPGKKIIVQLGEREGYENYGSDAHFLGTRLGPGVIYISRKVVDRMPRRQMLADLVHEFGHAIMWAKWQDTDIATQQAIYRAFQRHLERTKGMSGLSWVADFMSPLQLAKLHGETIDELASQSRADALQQNEWLGSWYSFDEWIAEQVSRYLLGTEKRAVSIAEKWFKALADGIRKLFSAFSEKDGAVEPEVELWLSNMLEKTGKGAPQSLLGMRQSLKEGIIENAVLLKETDLTVVAPPQVENIFVKQALSGVGAPKRIGAEQDQYTHALRFWPNLLQLTEKNRHIAPLQNYTEFVREWQIEKMKIVSNADGIAKDWNRLGKLTSKNLSNFLYDLDGMSYLGKGENARWPTQEELVALAKKHGLNKPALDVYFRIKAAFLDTLARIERSWIKDATKSLKDPLALKQALFEIATEMAALRSKPYFPHERFGDWTVTHWNSNGKVVFYSQFRTAKEANQFAEARRKQFPQDRIGAGKLSEEVKIFRGLPPTLVKQLAGKLKGLTAAQREQLEQMAFDLSPANSFAKHQMRRKGTPGFSNDGLRSFANYFLHAGNHIARLEWRADMEEAIQGVELSAREMVGRVEAQDVARRQGIADWLKRHFDYIMNPPKEWNALRSFAFFWYMGANASSALINLTQVPMVAWPMLASRYGDVKSQGALMKATLDLHKLYKLDPKAMRSDEIVAIREGIAQGFLDESQNADLAGMAQHGTLARLIGGSKVERGLKNVTYYASYLFQAIEKANRRVVFRAAYNLAKGDPTNKHVIELIQANGMLYRKLLADGWRPEHAGAFLAARDAIEKSQFNYASYARPEFIRGRKGVLFAFWMFKQNMLYFFKNDPGAGRALLVMMATAGLMGLPFAQDASDFVKYAARLFGVDFNPEQEARQMVKDLAGISGANDGTARRVAEVLMNGFGKESFGMAWAAQGLGIPFPGIDVSTRLGMGNVIPGLKPLMQGLTQELKPNESLGQVTAEILGASYGVPLAILRGVETGDLDEYKSWERLLPSAAKNLIRAIRYAEQGEETTRTGASIAQFDITDTAQAAEVAAQALGFTPTQVSREWDKIGAQKEAIRYWTLRRKLMFDQFDRALQSRDREALADAKQALRRFNSEAPDKRLRITSKAIKESFAQREKARRKMESGQAVNRSFQGLADEISGAYPE